MEEREGLRKAFQEDGARCMSEVWLKLRENFSGNGNNKGVKTRVSSAYWEEGKASLIHFSGQVRGKWDLRLRGSRRLDCTMLLKPIYGGRKKGATGS